MARPREYDGALRIRLIDTAARLLTAEGPHALTTRRVAAEAGTSTTAIYSLIGAKDELIRAMYRDGFRRMRERFDAVPADDDPIVYLRALGRAYHDNAVENPHLYDIMFGRPIPEFECSDEDRAYSFTTLQTMIDACQACVDAGEFTGNGTDIAIELWATSHGMAMLTNTGMAGTPDEALAHLDRMATALVEGYRRHT